MNTLKWMKKPMNFMVVFGFLILATSFALTLFGASQQKSLSAGVGGVVGLFNFAMLGVVVERFLGKKSIAWTFLLIVIKWAVVLGTVFFALAGESVVDRGYFIGGLAASLPLILAWAALRERHF